MVWTNIVDGDSHRTYGNCLFELLVGTALEQNRLGFVVACHLCCVMVMKYDKRETWREYDLSLKLHFVLTNLWPL